MMIMPADNSSAIVHYFCGRYPGKIGRLISPLSYNRPPYYMPYAVDNGAFVRWDADGFKRLLGWITFIHRPLWILVPDVVGDRDKTLKMWDEWSPVVAETGNKLAFAAQDGMTENDVPPSAHCVFVGGTTDWKLENAHRFKGVAPLLHIGRVSTASRLRWAEKIGADSVDGTGFFRGGINRQHPLIDFIEGRNQGELDDNW